MATTFYTPQYFNTYELCDKEFYLAAKKANEVYIYWQFNPLVLITADRLRKRYGPGLVNNWYEGGHLSQRGLRTSATSKTGAMFGPHKRGAALDMNFKHATPAEMWEDMKKAGCFKPGFRDNINSTNECFEHIGRVEMTISGKPITWFHFDIWNSQNPDGSIDQLHV